MASLRILPVMIAILFYILFYIVAHTTVATNAPNYLVQGRVYCDTCRAGFETNVTEYMKGAKVRLECKHFGTGVVERTIDGMTEETGTYKIELKGSHAEDICEVVLVQSSRANCARDAGICDNLCLANRLSYFKDVPLPVCGALLKQFNLADNDQ